MVLHGVRGSGIRYTMINMDGLIIYIQFKVENNINHKWNQIKKIKWKCNKLEFVKSLLKKYKPNFNKSVQQVKGFCKNLWNHNYFFQNFMLYLIII